MDNMMPTFWLAAYAIAVVSATFIHHPAILALALVMVLTLAGRARWQLLRRAFKAILFINLTVSLGFVLLAGLRNEFHAEYLLVVNLRVLLMVLLGFWFVSRVNLLRALAFSPSLVWMATLAIGQIQTFRRITADHRLALQSRSPEPPRLAERMHSSMAEGRDLLDKSMAISLEAAQAMRSRGCFDD